MYMVRTKFNVWVDCTVLHSYETLEDAVNNARSLIEKYVEKQGECWDDDEAPCIYEERISSYEIRGDHVEVMRQYDIDGNLQYDFEKWEKEQFDKYGDS